MGKAKFPHGMGNTVRLATGSKTGSQELLYQAQHAPGVVQPRPDPTLADLESRLERIEQHLTTIRYHQENPWTIGGGVYRARPCPHCGTFIRWGLDEAEA